ncbi:MAG TPA: multidrug efflux SMR transporter [Planctomycetaceae bacterium]
MCGTTCMKLAEGFTRPVPGVLIFVFYGVSFVFLTLALKGLPLGVAYAIWSGVGTATLLFVGNRLFGEPITPAKLLAVGLIVAGVVWLRLFASDGPAQDVNLRSGGGARRV